MLAFNLPSFLSIPPYNCHNFLDDPSTGLFYATPNDLHRMVFIR